MTPEPSASPICKSCNMGAAADRPFRNNCAYPSIVLAHFRPSWYVPLTNFFVWCHACSSCLPEIHIYMYLIFIAMRLPSVPLSFQSCRAVARFRKCLWLRPCIQAPSDRRVILFEALSKWILPTCVCAFDLGVGKGSSPGSSSAGWYSTS